MSKQIHQLHVLADLLGQRCPFILFATLEQDHSCLPAGHARVPRLAVYLAPGTVQWKALAELLDVLEEASWPGLEVVILNHSDPETRFRAAQGIYVTAGEGLNERLQLFRQQASLDYRLFRAHLRRKGLIDIEEGPRR